MKTWIYYTNRDFSKMYRGVAEDETALAKFIAREEAAGNLILKTTAEPLTLEEEEKLLNEAW